MWAASPSQRVKTLNLSFKALTQPQIDEFLGGMEYNRRMAMKVKVSTSMCFQRFINAKMMTQDECTEIKRVLQQVTRQRGLTHALRVLFVSATEHGGGVAEMRLDTTALLRDLGAKPKWLVTDGAERFYTSCNKIREGIQNPNYEPLQQADVETYHLASIVNYLRMEQEHPPSEIDAVWIDDIQPLGLGLLLKSLHPDILLLWRCHQHVDPEPSIGDLIRDLTHGTLRTGRDDVLLQFLSRNGYSNGKGQDVLVFHHKAFADSLRVAHHPGVHIMPPCINPLAFKNMRINDYLVEATLVKYGVMTPKVGRNARVPPFILQVSRFDPYKAPLEVITGFVEAVKGLPEQLQREICLVLVSTRPGDDEKMTALRLSRVMQSFVDALDLDAFSKDLQPGGPMDLRKRIYILMLDDKTPWERLVEFMSHKGDLDPDRMAGIAREIQELAELPIAQIIERLDSCGLISRELATECGNEPLPTGITFTSEQKKAVLEVIANSRAERHPAGDPVIQRRAEQGSFTGKELNAFEVSAFQSAALVTVQFSSKEGFGLTVSESLIKELPGYEGVLVGTLVGGIRSQAEVCNFLTIEYPPEEAAASLARYRAIPESPDHHYFRDVYKEIAVRKSVQKLTEHVRNGATMPDYERQRMSKSAREGVLQNFSTWVNLRNILEGIALAAKLQPDLPPEWKRARSK